ncbi:MAG: hypothetical protein K2P87_09935 [Lachnospiraceae bacterium]|nr:hypothetical protein [Lachnospiraceae bacterium]
MSKQTNVATEKENTNGKLKLPVRAIAAGAVVIVLIVIALLVESANTKRIVIENDTDKDIESVRLYFENSDEDYFFMSEDLVNTPVAAGEKYTGSFQPQTNIAAPGYFLMIRVKFAGEEEIETYAGYFTRIFTGKISLDFTQKDDNVLMGIKAGDGLFNSTKYTDCDEEQELYE